MAFTYVTVTHQFEAANDTPASGSVEFKLVAPMHNGTTTIPATTLKAVLSATGTISQVLAANTDTGTQPGGTTYQVTEKIDGQTAFTYYVQVPHNLGSTVNLATLTSWVGGGTGGTAGVMSINSLTGVVTLSAPDIGAQLADADLTGLAALGDGVPSRSAGTWSARTASQLRGDISATNVTVDGTHSDTFAINSTPVTAADVGAVATTGGTISGDLRIQDSGNTHAYRFTASGSGVPLYYEVGGENLVFRTNSAANFGGTSREYIRCSKDVQELQLAGEVQFRNSIGGTTVHDIDPSTGVAAIGAKNGLTNLRFCGFKNTSGAPTTGTWAVGDLVMDSAKVWWRCSVAGTPGTWV